MRVAFKLMKAQAVGTEEWNSIENDLEFPLVIKRCCALPRICHSVQLGYFQQETMHIE